MLKRFYRLFLLSLSVILLLGGSGVAALWFGLVPKDNVIMAMLEEPVECTILSDRFFLQSEERWMRLHIGLSETDGLERVATALAYARQQAEERQADLVTVVVSDLNGPRSLPLIRGHYIGAQVVYAGGSYQTASPRSSGFAQRTIARYIDTLPNAAGQFFGDRVTLEASQLDALWVETEKPVECLPPENPVREAKDDKSEAGVS